MHTLPELPYPLDALQPLMSAETLRFHHGKHHKGYVKKLSELVSGTRHEAMALPELLREAHGGVLDNAAQHFNHSFFWQCLRPAGGPGPLPLLRAAIERSWGSVELFRDDFSARATELFGSGWCWLAQSPGGLLSVEPMENAGCPVTSGRTPLLVLDVWEHAYYIDHRNSRKRYVGAFWQLANWEFAESQLRLSNVANEESAVLTR